MNQTKSISRRPHIHYSWVILGILVLAQVVGQSIGLSAGIMVAPLTDPLGDFGWGVGITGTGLALYFFVGACIAPASGWLADRYGARITMLYAGLLYGTSMILLAFITAIWHFFFVFGVMLALTQSIAMVPLIAKSAPVYRCCCVTRR